MKFSYSKILIDKILDKILHESLELDKNQVSDVNDRLYIRLIWIYGDIVVCDFLLKIYTLNLIRQKKSRFHYALNKNE